MTRGKPLRRRRVLAGYMAAQRLSERRHILDRPFQRALDVLFDRICLRLVDEFQSCL